jgi:hypothetical protein
LPLLSPVPYGSWPYIFRIYANEDSQAVGMVDWMMEHEKPLTALGSSVKTAN